jgi:hypothetical protein
MKTEAIRLNSSVLEHLKAFQQEDDSFKTLPSSKGPPEDPNISVGSTCTALMALLATNKHRELLSRVKGVPEETKVDIAELFRRTVRSKWESSGLPDGNAFTTALVIRTAGFVAKARILTPVEIAALRHSRFSTKNEKGEKIEDDTVADKTLKEIIQTKAKDGGDAFAVSKYPAKTSIAYWFMDGAISAGVELDDYLEKIAQWATQEFHRQLI